MIYECLQCQAPQLPGDVACPHCGAQFAGPVPEDATLQEEPEASPPSADAGQDAAPLPPPPTPFPAPPASAASATTYAPYTAPTGPTRASYPPLLLVGAGLGILALMAVVYFIMTLGQTAVSSPSPPPPPLISQPAAPILPVSTRPTAITTPGPSPAGGAASAEAAPVGRWMTKTFDYYEFDRGGSGSRGGVNDGKPAVTFSWVVVKNQLVLSLTPRSAAPEQVPFSYGPGGATLYLRQPDGRYLEYTRTEPQ